MFNGNRAHQQNSLFYRDAPILLGALLMVLYLEKKPFEDSKATQRYIDIDSVNDERLEAFETANEQCWNEVIDKIRHCDNSNDAKEIIRQADEQTAKNVLMYQLIDNPVFPRPEQKKKSIFLNIFIHVASFFLCVLAVLNYIFLFHWKSFPSFNRGNSTHLL
ncbi:unnamed protein product [Rotaria magnacalcarata]|uniref:Uncharacterized protein n=1 Tax=Rotaria magnacalcarata TaxID=392030 RepID=A0A8S3JWA2_9BILA|nr:unnamed protein product [Rotaria magnacalcarata]CAF5223048.1 unnamed protein product [Rotaria magnacalcarata]